MQTRHVLITLLVAAHILVALVVMVWAQLPERSEGRMLLLVVSFGQIGLLSIWTALGRRAAPWRPVALIATIVAWLWVAPKIGSDANSLFFFLLVAVAATAILAAARGFNLRLFLPDDDPTDNDGPWQFSLSRLFAWTTSLSICLGLLSPMFRYFRVEYNATWLTSLVVNTIVLTPIVLIAPSMAWMQLRFSHIASAIFALLALLLFVYWVSPNDFGEIIMFCGLELLFMVSSLVVVRVAGYRLGRIRA